ncbi:MAG: cytochrome c oxidase accessory protein CcoG [Alphaproteobacteria bacterium]|nr:cytochrome c oxidase accessory protein CcoG [Alphaproteobacteria bacterium]
MTTRDTTDDKLKSDDTFIEGPLYEKREKVYPQSVEGPVRRIKWALVAFTLAVFYLLPFVRWDRGLGLPTQAVLADLPHRRFYFFFIGIWPQEVYYFTGLLILAALILFLMNALAGRIWCGYLCWQTVWTDLFLAVERWTEGDRRERILAEKHGWTFKRMVRFAIKHIIWLLIALATGTAFVLYFDDAPTLLKNLVTLEAPSTAYIWIAILTGVTYLFAGTAREQVCIYMCPWPRIQAALTDEWALNVSYRRDRGDPRMSVKKADHARAAGNAAGDCIDCRQCVFVCPTGVDIRDGIQLGCIQCGLCIDACNKVMRDIDRPGGLIAYDTDINIARHRDGLAPIYRLIRPRTLIYAALILVVGCAMVYRLSTRGTMDLNVLHDRNPLTVTLSDGGVRNAYTVRLFNFNMTKKRTFSIAVSNLPGAVIHVAGVEPQADGSMVVGVEQDQTRELRLTVQLEPNQLPKSAVTIGFELKDMETGETATTRDHFIPSDG